MVTPALRACSVTLALAVAVCAPALALETGYDRSDWPHWLDLDGDCQDERAEALIRAAEWYELTPDGCRVVRLTYVDSYTCDRWERVSARGRDIDHRVTLYDAHHSGGDSWTREERAAFANDSANLVVTSARINRSKGSRSPAAWLPECDPCGYGLAVIETKDRYGLSLSAKEAGAIVRACGGDDGRD